jgi:hypothetical protein
MTCFARFAPLREAFFGGSGTSGKLFCTVRLAVKRNLTRDTFWSNLISGEDSKRGSSGTATLHGAQRCFRLGALGGWEGAQHLDLPPGHGRRPGTPRCSNMEGASTFRRPQGNMEPRRHARLADHVQDRSEGKRNLRLELRRLPLRGETLCAWHARPIRVNSSGWK